jgi:phosphoglycolate phosphatase
MKFSTVLFDLDGTLIDTKPGVLRSVRTTLRELGVPEPEEKQLIKFLGPPLKVCFTEIIGLGPDDADRAMAIFRHDLIESGNAFDCNVYPGMPELLGRLRDGGVKLGVATSKLESLAVKILAKKGIAEYFGAVSGSPIDDPAFTKADSIRGAVARIPGARADRTCALVGDRLYDAGGAKQAGITGIGVGYGFGSPQEIASAGFDLTAADMGALSSLLLS